jgi:hypothetical protein
MIETALRLVLFGRWPLLVGHALARIFLRLVLFLVPGALLLVAVADTSHGLAHSDLTRL